MRTTPIADEMVPLAERLRYLQLYRLLLAVSAVASVAVDDVVPGDVGVVGATTGLFLGVCVGAHAAWRWLPRRRFAIVSATLVVDGLYLVYLAHLTGGVTSPLRYALLLHVVTVTLLASYRTGLKVAFWHAALLLSLYHAERSGVLERMRPSSPSEYGQLVLFVLALWVLAITTAAFSAVNERELRRRKYDLQALAAMADTLEHQMQPLAVAQVLLDSVVGAFDFTRGAVLASRDGDLDTLAVRASDGQWSGPPAADGVIMQAWGTREPVLLRGLVPGAEPGLDRLFQGAANIVVVPLLAEGRPIGVLAVELAKEERPRIHRRIVDMVEQFTSHAALALVNAWLLDDVQRVAATDGLTGIANRRTFDFALEREIARASRTGGSVGLLLIDIDWFKLLNDTHGHQVGDDVLREVALVFADGCRSYDVAARYGGEEFGIILPACSAPEALAIGESLRKAIESAPTTVAVTVSVGVAACPADGDDAGALVAAADQALYEAKHSGRNRVCVSTGGTDTSVGAVRSGPWAPRSPAGPAEPALRAVP